MSAPHPDHTDADRGVRASLMSKGRWLAGIGLILVFVVGWVLFSTVIVVRGVVLDHATYTSSLVKTNAYERVYTQVLADPEMADLQEQLLGRLSLGSTAATEVRVVKNNVLRLVVPPSLLRSASEQVISRTVAYVRGDTDRLDIDVAIDGVLASIETVAVVEARTALAYALDRTVASLPAFEDAVRRFVDELVAGTVPDSVPALSATIDAGQVAQVVLIALGPLVTDEVRQQVLAAVTVEDERDALITAAGGLVADHAARVAAQLGATTGTDGELDVVAIIADHAGQPARSVVDSFDAVRDVASWFAPLTGAVGVLLAVAAATGLAWMHRRSPRSMLVVLAVAFVVAGMAQLAIWLLVVRQVPTPFDAATSTGASSWRLPSGLRSLLWDIQHTVTREIVHSVARVSLVVILPGVVLAVAAVLASSRWLRQVPVVAVGVAGCFAVAAIVAGSGVLARPGVEKACNGHVELCDRHYDDVVYAATHNAMSSPDVVRFWPEQDYDLRQQLDSGVRALLIDTHYWLPVRSPSGLIDVQQAIDAAEPRLPLDVADALYPTLGTLRNGRDGTFLCHLQCAFGAMAFLDGMVTVRTFLEANPDDVVTLIIQDAVSTADTEAVMHAAGLDSYLYRHRGDQTWPTLGQMIDDGRRLVVFAEVAAPPPAWYANAFQKMQETPFMFSSPAAFSCVASRGVADAPLFLMNHWVVRVPPDRVNATIVNTKEFLVDRARRCERERGLRPNYLAVDFSNIGDVVAAVEELNGDP